MADTHWDPGNLLQISESDNAPEIQCVGRARSRHGARCRWTLRDSDATAVLRKVRELAVSPPSKVAQRDLEDLAKLCLCHDYHSGQWLDVAQRWKPVVAKAVKHHERLASQHGSPATEAVKPTPDGPIANRNLDSLEKELVSVRTNLSSSEDRRRRVEGELEHAKLNESTLAQDLVVVRRLLDEERTKTAALEQSVRTIELCVQEKDEELAEARRALEKARERMTDEATLALEQRDRLLAEQKTKTRRLEDATQNLEHQLSLTTVRTGRLLDDERTKIHQLEETIKTLRRQVSEAEARATKSAAEAESANRDNQGLRLENEAAATQFGHFQSDLVGVRAEIRRGQLLGQELQIARAENQVILSTHSELVAQNTALLEQITGLEASLARCWRHRLRAWLHKTSAPPRVHTLSGIQTQPSPVLGHADRPALSSK